MPGNSGTVDPVPGANAAPQRRRPLRSYVLAVNLSAGGKQCVGSAFLLGTDQDGAICAVTCRHVLQGRNTVYLWFKPDERPGTEVPADVLLQGQDEAHDIAILCLRGSVPAGLETLALEYWGDTQIAFETYGFAQDTNGHFIRNGQIDGKVPPPDGLRRLIREGDLFQLSLRNPVPGLSGAPVVLMGTGVVVGMINSGHVESSGHHIKDTGYAQLGDAILALCDRAGINPAIPDRRAWLKRMHFAHDPFARLDGANDPDVADYYWPLPEYAKISREPERPSMMLILGADGSGRSSLRQALDRSYRDWRLLTVLYDGDSFGDSGKLVTAAAHVPELIKGALYAIADDLERDEARMAHTRSARSAIREAFCCYIDGFMKDLVRAQRLRELLALPCKPAADLLSVTGRELLKQFCGHVRDLFGYKGIVFLIDPHESDVDAVWRVFKPLIEAEQFVLFDREPIGFRFFLPEQLKSKALAIGWVRNKRDIVFDERALSWDEEKLRAMLCYRLGACSSPQDLYPSLAALAPAVADLDDIALKCSGGTPYGLIAFGDRLLDLLCVEPIDPANPYISLEVVQQAQQEFERRLAEQEVERLAEDGESQTLELKSTLRYNLRSGKKDDEMEREVAQAICGFRNSRCRGTLIIGVGDDGEAIGIQPDLSTLGRNAGSDKFERAFDNVLEKYLRISVRHGIETSWKTYRGEQVFCVEVNPGQEPVYFFHDNMPHYYLRQENQTKYLDTQATVEHILSRYPHYRRTHLKSRKRMPGRHEALTER